MEFADSTRGADCFKDIRTYLTTGMRIKEDRDGGGDSHSVSGHMKEDTFSVKSN